MLPDLYAHALNAFLMSVLLVVGLRPLARNIGLVDLPGPRKHHDGAVPLCGGLAIFAAFAVAGIGLADGYRLPWNWALGLAMLGLLGLADDRWRLTPPPRLIVQAFAAAILAVGAGAATLVVGRYAPDNVWYLSAPMAGAFSLLFIVGTVNAVNMIDGADGVAGASVAAALFWLSLIAIHAGNGMVAMQALVLLAAILGFLLFNARHPWRGAASVFLGDAGATVLGGALATFVVHLSSGGDGLSFVALLWLVAVPGLDTLSLIVRRAAAGRNPLSSDRWHLHHLLLDAGVAPAAVAPVIAGAGALCGAVAYVGILFRVPDIYMALGLLVPLFVHTVFVLASQGQLLSAASGGPRRGRLQPAHRSNELIG